MDAFFHLDTCRRYAREGETGSKGSHFLIIRSDKGELGKFVVSNWEPQSTGDDTCKNITIFIGD